MFWRVALRLPALLPLYGEDARPPIRWGQRDAVAGLGIVCLQTIGTTLDAPSLMMKPIF